MTPYTVMLMEGEWGGRGTPMASIHIQARDRQAAKVVGKALREMVEPNRAMDVVEVRVVEGHV